MKWHTVMNYIPSITGTGQKHEPLRHFDASTLVKFIGNLAHYKF